jgi:hypothetical protein
LKNKKKSMRNYKNKLMNLKKDSLRREKEFKEIMIGMEMGLEGEGEMEGEIGRSMEKVMEEATVRPMMPTSIANEAAGSPPTRTSKPAQGSISAAPRTSTPKVS